MLVCVPDICELRYGHYSPCPWCDVFSTSPVYANLLFCTKRGALMMSEDKPVLYSLFLCGWLWLLSGAGTNMDPHNNLHVAEIV